MNRNQFYKFGLAAWKLAKTFWNSKNPGLRIARVLLLVYFGIIICAMAFEDRLIYFPVKYPEGFWEVNNIQPGEGQVAPKIEDCRFTTEDGVSLHGWYCAPQRNVSGRLEPVPCEM